MFSLQTRLSNVKMEHVLVTTGCLTLNLLNTTALTTPSSPRQHNTLVSLLNTFSKTSTCRIFISSAVCSKLGWNLDGGKTACARFPLWCPKTSDSFQVQKVFFCFTFRSWHKVETKHNSKGRLNMTLRPARLFLCWFIRLHLQWNVSIIILWHCWLSGQKKQTSCLVSPRAVRELACSRVSLPVQFKQKKTSKRAADVFLEVTLPSNCQGQSRGVFGWFTSNHWNQFVHSRNSLHLGVNLF